MPIKGRDRKYRPLGYKGEPMNKREYERYMSSGNLTKRKKTGTPKFDARKRSAR